jgi:hypothetical protein
MIDFPLCLCYFQVQVIFIPKWKTTCHPHTGELLNNLIDLYKAEKWRAKLPQTETVEE